MKWYFNFMIYVLDTALSNTWQLHRICYFDSHLDILSFPRYLALESNANTSREGGVSGWRLRANSNWGATGSCIRRGGRVAPSAIHRPTPGRSATRAAWGPCPSSAGKKRPEPLTDIICFLLTSMTVTFLLYHAYM